MQKTEQREGFGPVCGILHQPLDKRLVLYLREKGHLCLRNPEGQNFSPDLDQGNIFLRGNGLSS